MKYMQKNHKKIFLLADSEENLGKVEAVLSGTTGESALPGRW